MEMASVGGIIGLVFFLFFMLLYVALLVALQVWLCKKSVKLGLILPGITLALSLVMVFSMAAFSTLTFRGGNTLISGGANYVGPDGQEVPGQVEIREEKEAEFHPRILIAAGAVFLVTNIPTVVFGGIWLHYKGRRDAVEDLKRMQIEDLG